MFHARQIAHRQTSRVLGLFGQHVRRTAKPLSYLKANQQSSTIQMSRQVLIPSSTSIFNRCMSTSTKKSQFEVINVQDEEDFQKRVLEADKPVVLDFHATWCGPCKLLGPRLESILAEQCGKVVMAKVDIDDCSDLAMNYGVRSVPTVMGLKNGKVQDQFIGVVDDDKIRAFIDKLTV